MTNEEFTLYWEPARNTFGNFKGKAASRDHPSYLMSEALGLYYPSLGYWHYIELTDDLKNILLALVSPYRETMLKIYQIRRDQDEQQRHVRQKRRADLRQIKQDDCYPTDNTGDDPSTTGSQAWD